MVTFEQEKVKLLEGLDEYYASRIDLRDSGNSDERTKVINGLTYVVVNMSTEEWAKQNDAIPIEETFLVRKRYETKQEYNSRGFK